MLRPPRLFFRLFSMSGIWHLCRWPQRLQGQSNFDHAAGWLSGPSQGKPHIAQYLFGIVWQREYRLCFSVPSCGLVRAALGYPLKLRLVRRFATRIGAIRVNRFAGMDSQKKNPLFITCERFARIASNPRFANFSPPKTRKCDSHKKGVQFGNPDTIRKNQAIRANLRIDWRESGHLSVEISVGNMAPQICMHAS